MKVPDKSLPFYTDEDRLALKKIHEEQQALILEIRYLDTAIDDAEKAGDEDLRKQNLDEQGEIFKGPYADLQSQENAILEAVEQRYTDSFSADPSAVLSDVHEVVAAISKNDYVSYQQRMTAMLKNIVENPHKDQTKDQKKLRRQAIDRSRKGFSNCRDFILLQLRLQLNVAAFYVDDELERQIVAIAEQKAETFYSRPKSAKPAKLPTSRTVLPPVTAGSSVIGAFITMPSSPIISAASDVLTIGDLDLLPGHKAYYNRNQKIKLFTDQQKESFRQVSFISKNEKIDVSFDDITLLAKSYKDQMIKKIFNRILMHALEQGGDIVSFPLQELLGDEQYLTIDTARVGFMRVGKILRRLSFGVTVYGKGKRMSGFMDTGLFSSVWVDRSVCYVRLSPDVPWNAVLRFRYALPDYYYELPGRAAALLECIYQLARQNAERIAETGSFTISFRKIQDALNLPNEDNTKNPKRDIRDPLEDAVDLIEEKYRQYAPPIPKEATGKDAEPDFALLLRVDDKAPIKRYLDEGKLEVFFKGAYAQQAFEISKRVKASKARQKRVEEKAAALKLAKADSTKK